MLKMSLWGKLHVSNLRFLSVQVLINVLSMTNNLKKLCHTSCFLTAICYGLGLSLQKNGWLSWGGVQTDIPKTSHPCVFAFIFVLYLSFYLHLFLRLCLSSFFLTGGCWSNGAIERMVELRWCSNKQTTSIPFSNNFSGNSALVGISLKTKKIQKRSLSMH